MTFRSLTTLESWLDEFRRDYPALEGRMRVVPQDGTDGADTGLVVIELVDAPTVTYLQPDSSVDGGWAVTMESREEAITLDGAQLRALASDLDLVGQLCSFLERKARAARSD